MIPCGLSLLCINLLETMVAINVVDQYTASDSEQDRVFYGQGVANLACGLMGGTGVAGSPHASLHGLRAGGATSTATFLAGVCMLLATAYAYPAVASMPLGATMGVTLHLAWSAIQWTPIISLVVGFVPDGWLETTPALGRFRLASPDLFSTFVTSIFALSASTYALAGYRTGVLCYACDPIGHGECVHVFRFQWFRKALR